MYQTENKPIIKNVDVEGILYLEAICAEDFQPKSGLLDRLACSTNLYRL